MERETPCQQGIDAAKKETRRLIRERVRVLSAEQMAAMSACICRRLVTMIEDAGLLKVAIFAARHGEVDLMPLLKMLPNVAWYFPLVHEGRRLTFHHIQGAHELVSGAFGIREPEAQAPVIAPEELHMVVLPGAAFTPEGDRLGYGGGFYDTLMPKLNPQAHKVGVCFPCQILPHVPVEPHDCPVDVVISSVKGTSIYSNPAMGIKTKDERLKTKDVYSQPIV